MEEKRRINPAIVLLLLALAALIAVGGLYYARVYRPRVQESLTYSTRYSAGVRGPVKDGEELVLAEKNGITVSRNGDFITVTDKDGVSDEYSDWRDGFGSNDTRIYELDANGDGTDDIIILDDEGEDETSFHRLTGLYVLLRNTADDARAPFQVFYTNAENWLSFFNSVITCALNQPAAHPQLVQFVMDLNGVSVEYDSETGLALPEYRAYYMNALKDTDGNVFKLSSIRLSPAMISVNEEEGAVEMRHYVYAVYESGREQQVGTITGGISVEGGKLIITERSVVFEAKREYAVPTPER